MTSPTEITVSQLSKLIGLPQAPAIVDVRIDEDFDALPRLVPGSVRRSHNDVMDWAAQYRDRKLVIICHKGEKLSQGTAALLRSQGIDAETLEGGFVKWDQTKTLRIQHTVLPSRDVQGRTRWVTRARPKIDRIACPWLIRRFIDPDAVFMFVAPSEVTKVADKFDAAPFDIEDTFWSHRGEDCTFDTMVKEFGLLSPALDRLATIVRGADTNRLDLAPESAGLLAASLGYSRMYKDDLEQLDASMVLYDALYRWCRDATNETHDWPPHSSQRTGQ